MLNKKEACLRAHYHMLCTGRSAKCRVSSACRVRYLKEAQPPDSNCH